MGGQRGSYLDVYSFSFETTMKIAMPQNTLSQGHLPLFLPPQFPRFCRCSQHQPNRFVCRFQSYRKVGVPGELCLSEPATTNVSLLALPYLDFQFSFFSQGSRLHASLLAFVGVAGI